MSKITAKAWVWKGKGEPNELILNDFTIEDERLKENEVIVQNTYIG